MFFSEEEFSRLKGLIGDFTKALAGDVLAIPFGCGLWNLDLDSDLTDLIPKILRNYASILLISWSTYLISFLRSMT
jgi:hypothetical protein